MKIHKIKVDGKVKQFVEKPVAGGSFCKGCDMKMNDCSDACCYAKGYCHMHTILKLYKPKRKLRINKLEILEALIQEVACLEDELGCE